MKQHQNKRLLFIALPLLLLFGFLTYHYMYGGAKQVGNNYAQLAYTFTAHKAEVWKVAFSQTENLVASASVDSTVNIWKPDGTVVGTLKHPIGVTGFACSPDDKQIITAAYDSKVRLWDVTTRTILHEFSGHEGTVWSVAFSSDGHTVASSGDDGIIRLWDVKKGSLMRQLKGHTLNVWSVKFSPDGKQLASSSFDKTVRLWNVATGQLQRTMEGHRGAVVDLAYSHNGQWLATVSDDATTRLWRVRDGAPIRTLSVPEHIQGVAFSPDNKRLLTSGRDKTSIGELVQNFMGNSRLYKGVSARLWNLQNGELLQTFEEHANDVNDVAFSPDGKWIATASSDYTVQLWKMVK